MRRPAHTAMLHLILGALGASALGCAPEVDIEGQGGGGSGSASSGSKSSSKATTNATVTSNNSAIVASSGAGVCPMPISTMQIPTPMSGPCSGPFVAQYICFPQTSGVSCDQAYSQECVLEAYGCGFQEVGDKSCGPDQMGMGCCYTVVGDCPVGRPFLVGGSPRRALTVTSRGWLSQLDVAPSLDGLDARTRSALSAFWAEEGLAEHASIASFSRFLMELLALGAPLDLAQRAQRALAEEIDHARVAFAFATAYEGSPVGPGALDPSGALAPVDRSAIACAIAREGCVGETVASLQIAAARDAATDPAVRSALTRIAGEEAEHALLAWRTLAWILDATPLAERGALTRELRGIFDEAAAHVGLGPSRPHAGDDARMRAHGCLPLEERRALAHASLSHVVRPAADALLGPRLEADQKAPAAISPGSDRAPSV